MKNLFLWEIRKNVKKGAIVGVSIALVVLLVLIAVAFNLIYEVMQDGMFAVENGALPEETPETGIPEETGYYLSESDLDAMIDETRRALEEEEKDYAENKNATGYASVFRQKTALATLEYAKKHGLFDKEVKLYGINYAPSLTAESFVSMYLAVVALIVSVYGIVLAANTYPNEYKSGTIKLLMTRPIGKNSLTAAKLLSLYAVLAVFFFVPLLLAYAYGAIAFGTEATESVVYGFNAMGAGRTTVGALAFGEVMNKFLGVIVLATVSFSLATLTRNSVAGLLPALVILLGLGGLLNGLGISAFLLSEAMDLSVYFGLNTVPYHGNFFLSLGIVVFWLVAALVGTFVVTEKRDVY